MSIFKDIVRRYTIAHDSELKRLTQPLFDAFQIPYFTYFQVKNEGEFAVLSNCTEHTDYYFAHELYAQNPFHVDPCLVHSGCVLVNHTQDTGFLENESSLNQKFNMGNPFLIVEKKYELMEGFYFATKPGSDFTPFYFEHVYDLKRFGRYFVEENKQLIKKMLDDGYNLKAAKGEAYSKRNTGLPLSAQSKARKKFLKAIWPLTKTENECIELFYEGHTAQATAAILKRSRRTVEHHFDSIKAKLKCSSKGELIRLK